MEKKVNALRNEGRVPAVVYGGKGGTVPLVLDAKEFNKLFKVAGETTLIKLSVDGSVKNVLIHDVSRDTMTGKVEHVDFYEVKMDEKIVTKVPLEFVGVSLAVVDLGGVLVKAMQELEVRALPADLPREIVIDISALKTFEDHLLLKDIKLPSGVETLGNPETPIASVTPPRSEAEMEALSGEVKEEVETVAVETEEKVAERAKEKETVPEAKS